MKSRHNPETLILLAKWVGLTLIILSVLALGIEVIK